MMKFQWTYENSIKNMQVSAGKWTYVDELANSKYVGKYSQPWRWLGPHVAQQVDAPLPWP